MVARLALLTAADSYARLGSVPIGRVCFVADGALQVFPVTFALAGNHVVFRSSIGFKLDAADMGRNVAFEVDEWDPGTRRGWSVVVRGPARRVVDPDRVAELDLLAPRAWLEVDDWIEIPIVDISGRSLVPFA